MMKLTRESLVTLGRNGQRTRLPSLRRLSLTVVAAMALAVAGLAADPAVLAKDLKGNEHWVGTWTASPRIPTGTAATIAFNNQTLRQIVHTSIGGDQVRVRLTNTFGTVPVVIGAARIAFRDTGAAIVPASDRVLTFGGASSITIEAGAYVVSDPVDLAVPADGDLAVSIYLPGNLDPAISPNTVHSTARQTNYFSAPMAGDHTGDVALLVDTTTTSWWFLMGVDVAAAKETGAVVTLGDSITDGTASTLDANSRYPNYLARRLLARPGKHEMGVLNAGIAGNRVTTGGSGPSVQARLDRDVLAQPGVTHVIVLEGINDSSRTVFQADRIIAGHKQIIERARERGLPIFGATLTPAGSDGTREANRQAVNEWIRTSGAYDGVIDFDVVTRDPANPTFFLPVYDSGDHLHPSDAGYQAMAEAIDLKLFKKGEGH